MILKETHVVYLLKRTHYFLSAATATEENLALLPKRFFPLGGKFLKNVFECTKLCSKYKLLSKETFQSLPNH